MLNININLCKGCSFCTKFCPNQILSLSTQRNKTGHFYPLVSDEAKCISCAMCSTICPEGAIELTEKEEA